MIDINQDVEDMMFLEDLHKYVSQLPQISDEDLAVYEQKYLYMEQIHNEIREKNPSFMPFYDHVEETEVMENKNKYLDIVYRVSSFDNSVDND